MLGNEDTGFTGRLWHQEQQLMEENLSRALDRTAAPNPDGKIYNEQELSTTDVPDVRNLLLSIRRAFILRNAAAGARRLYIQITIDDKTWNTPTVENTGKPIWDWKLRCRANLSWSVSFELMDDTRFPQTSVGRAQVELNPLFREQDHDGKPAGLLVVQLQDVSSIAAIWGHTSAGDEIIGLGIRPEWFCHKQWLKLPKKTAPSFKVQYNNILGSEDAKGNRCTNQLSADHTQSKVEKSIEDASGDPQYVAQLGLAHRVFYACSAAALRVCRNPGCNAYYAELQSVIPQCSTWPGLQHWACQAAACLCFQITRGDSSPSIARVVDHVCRVIYTYEGVLPVPRNVYSKAEPLLSSADVMVEAEVEVDVVPDFIAWAGQVQYNDILLLLSWLRGLATGTYEPISLTGVINSWQRTLQEGTRQVKDKSIIQAISRVRAQGLCPRRIWAIALNLPGRESNIPVLISNESQHNVDCFCNHNFCSTGPSHRNCTFEFCEISAVNFTNVVQRHRPGCDQNCKTKEFPAHLLDKVAEENRPTAWAIDDTELRPVEVGEPYMAISHVWSDGTGGNGSVHECMYNFFCNIARDLKCKGLWWDAICIPQGKQARAKAVNRMHEYYSQAACTVVHDLCLATSEWTGPDRACFTLIMSNWFTRGWTALELARSKNVEVLFDSKGSSLGCVRKNLDGDILSRAGTASSLPRLIASTAIRILRGVHEKQTKQQLTINDILTSLGPRFTSWVRDRAIITGLFVGIENLANDQHEMYRQVICKIGKISAGQLFHSSATSDGAWSWFPSVLFNFPVSPSTSEMLQVKENGDVVGQWLLLDNPDILSLKGKVHPLTESRIREALSSHRDQHVILAERNIRPADRGLVVKVMKHDKPSEVLCRYVGPIFLRLLELDPLDSVTVRIGSGGSNLHMGVKAIEYIRKEHGSAIVPRSNGQ
ncbi:hypothetical protein APHAL10511_005661 [Amanita phalloides]|nr:hypothetical protein APHAL10511_005661 [Amanita phalloides]